MIFVESTKKEAKRKIHEEVIAEDYDSTKDDINQIDISQKFMVNVDQSIIAHYYTVETININ